MAFNRFVFSLGLRLFLLVVVLAMLVYLIINPVYPISTSIVFLASIYLIFNLHQFVSKTNRELVRFLDALKYADFSQRFTSGNVDAGFGELSQSLTEILEHFREDRSIQEKQLRQLRALLEHVPVPLITIHSNGNVTIWNNAARRLFGLAKMNKFEDLRKFGQTFYDNLALIKPGENKLVEFVHEDIAQGVTISASEIIIDSKKEKLISLQNIQSELEGMQLTAWQDLVKVLTHEIMNSITPVASLSRTAADLVSDVSSRLSDHPEISEDLNDAKQAVMTVARRSDGLMGFVNSYRQFANFTSPSRQIFSVRALFDDVENLLCADWLTKGLDVRISVTPPLLSINADRQMIEQVIINLLQNAAHALESIESPTIELRALINKKGSAVIEICDNGLGIDDEIKDKIFVPFYTSRKEGSGVGLALSRQIMNAHGGSISFRNQIDGGVKFILSF